MKRLFCKLHTKYKKGFTLMEVLVVVVMLGVIAAIAIPTYNKTMQRSRVADGLNVLDLLSSAQGKYYIENGTYSSNLKDLNAPVKNFNENPGYEGILTSNFEYYRTGTKSCIFAQSRKGTGYTLVKNYKTNSKPFCQGQGCSDLSNFVDTTNNPDDLCPNGSQPCTNTCEEGYTLNTYTCECESNGITPPPGQECDEEGATRTVDTHQPCNPPQCGHRTYTEVCHNNHWTMLEGSETCSNDWIITQCGSSSNIIWENCICKTCQDGDHTDLGTIDDNSCVNPRGGKPLGKQARTATPPSGVCKMRHTWKDCENGVWGEEQYECINKEDYCASIGLALNPDTCQCIDPTNQCNPDEKPKCDGQVVDPGKASDPGTGGYNSCELFCSYKYQRAVCNTATGQWQPNCEVASQSLCATDYTPDTESCQGEGSSGSTCGIKTRDAICTLNSAHSSQANQITINDFTITPLDWGACELNTKAGNECWDTDEPQDCTTSEGRPGKRTCSGCHWDECVAQGCDGLDPLPQVNVGQCKMKEQECVQGTDGTYSWQYTSNIVWQPGAECETGATETCYVGGGSTRGSGGGRGYVPPGTGGEEPGTGNINGGGSPVLQGTRTCEDCKWSACMTCTGNPPTNPPSKKCDYTEDGVQYCGVQYADHPYCDSATGMWLWAWGSGNDCVEGVAKPEELPVATSSKGCFQRTGDYECSAPKTWTATYQGAAWVPTQPGNNCEDGITGVNYYQSEYCQQCKKYKCPSNAILNFKTKQCYIYSDVGAWIDYERTTNNYGWSICKPKVGNACRTGSHGTSCNLNQCPPCPGAPFPAPPSYHVCVNGTSEVGDLRDWSSADYYCRHADDPNKLGVKTLPGDDPQTQWCFGPNSSAPNSNWTWHGFECLQKTTQGYKCTFVNGILQQ